MTRLLFPFILFVSVAAAVMGMLNARHIFGIPASASTVFNIVSVISGVILACIFDPQKNWFHPHFGEKAIFGWCFGVLLGGLAQLGMQLPSLWSLGFRFKWKLDFADSALRTVMILMVPSAIAGSAVQVNVLVNGQFASYIAGHGPVSWLYYAFRLVQLPIGIFGVAIATVTLPAVARQHALDDLKAFGKTVEEALRFGFYLTLPASIGLAVIAQPVIQLIYEHGTFTAASTAQTALALQAYTIGLAGYSGIKILVPCFYAMQPPRFESRTERPAFGVPFPISCVNVVLFMPGAREPHRHRAELRPLSRALLRFSSGPYRTRARHRLRRHLQLPATRPRHPKENRPRLALRMRNFTSSLRVSMAATLACGCIVVFLATASCSRAHLWPFAFSARRFSFLISACGGRSLFLNLTMWMRVPESVELVAIPQTKIGRRPIQTLARFLMA